MYIINLLRRSEVVMRPGLAADRLRLRRRSRGHADDLPWVYRDVNRRSTRRILGVRLMKKAVLVDGCHGGKNEVDEK